MLWEAAGLVSRVRIWVQVRHTEGQLLKAGVPKAFYEKEHFIKEIKKDILGYQYLPKGKGLVKLSTFLMIPIS